MKIPNGNHGLVAEVHLGVVIKEGAGECFKEKTMDCVDGYVAVLTVD